MLFASWEEEFNKLAYLLMTLSKDPSSFVLDQIQQTIKNIMRDIVLRMDRGVNVQTCFVLHSPIRKQEKSLQFSIPLSEVIAIVPCWPRLQVSGHGLQTALQTVSQCRHASIMPHVTNQFPTQHFRPAGALSLSLSLRWLAAPAMCSFRGVRESG